MDILVTDLTAIHDTTRVVLIKIWKGLQAKRHETIIDSFDKTDEMRR